MWPRACTDRENGGLRLWKDQADIDHASSEKAKVDQAKTNGG